MEPLGKNELETIFNILSIGDIYKNFGNTENSNIYDDNCTKLRINEQNIKNLCMLLLKNINKLPNSQSEIEKHNLNASYLAYWLIHELSKLFTSNSDKDTRNIIDKIIDIGNESYYELNNKYLFYNSDFDFKWSNEEKYLNEYFKNYNKIKSCPKEKNETCIKYLNYIASIYDEHRKDCMWKVCHYFRHNPIYNPNDLLSTLKYNILGYGELENNRVLTVSSRESMNSNKSKEDMEMIIKYMSCYEVYDHEDKFFGYKCEDSAYHRHRERVYSRRSTKKKITSNIPISSVSVSNVMKEIKNLTCKEDNDFYNNKIVVCNNPKKPMSLSTSVSNQGDNNNIHSISNSGSVVSAKTNTRKNNYVKMNIQKNDELYPIIKSYDNTDNMYPGVTQLKGKRQVSEFRHEDEKDQTDHIYSKMKDMFLTTVFHEFSKEKLKDYFEVIDEGNSKSTTDRRNPINMKELKVEISEISTQPNSVSSNEDFKFTNKDIKTSLEGKLNIVSYITFRIFFTPFGSWIRKRVSKETVNDYSVYGVHIKNHPFSASKTKNTYYKKKRIQIAYNS
ncbi:variable surface protein [Plasmodium gonderi]|uniref:Variable surface protein n=1 Tax=Plasmodium gonderi TaxID=77519 RepID=A0A1Y1JXF2_PLAGO|nr:variable surface protein [Plasmodium gonderi]GAW84484.1 variable surface protein [Plasmodium gonderi]